jgi:transposase-like protein
LEALRGDKTVLELAQQYEIHPTVIHEWKRQLTESPASAF